MARKPRDYRAEEARRNQLARERGFTSRAAERGAKSRSDYARAGFASHAEYTRARAEARKRTIEKSRKPTSAFSPTMGPQHFQLYNSVFGHQRFESRTEFLKTLATYLHEVDPERFPPYTGNEAFWNAY